MKKKLWLFLTPLLIGCALWASFRYLINPRLEAFVLSQLSELSQQTPVSVSANRFHFSLLRPSITLEGIIVTSRDELTSVFETVDIGSAKLLLDIFQLVSGKVMFSALVVETPQTEINIDSFLSSKEPPKKLPLDKLFEVLEMVPLRRLVVQNISLSVIAPKNGLSLSLLNSDLSIALGQALNLRANIPALEINHQKYAAIQGAVDAQLTLTQESLKINQLSTRLNSSELSINGELNNFANVAIAPKGLLNISGTIELDEIYNEIKRLQPQLQFPAVKGEFKFSSKTRFNGLKRFGSTAEIKTRSIHIGDIAIGDATLQGQIDENRLSLSEMKVDHPSGSALLNNASLTFNENFEFQSQVRVLKMDLKELFNSLQLEEIPVGAQIKGLVPCTGQIRPEFRLDCQNVSLEAQDLWVHNSSRPKAFSIVNLDSMAASGKVTVTTKAVEYDAKIQVRDDTGESKGKIDFDKGFEISYKTERLQMKNIRNLVGLKFEGSAAIEGSTEGGTQAATFTMSLNGREFVFEDYGLGNLITNLSYKSGTLYFNDIAGAINRSQYLGNLEVDLNQDTLAGQFSVPTVDLKDIQYVFQRHLEIPLATSGLGSARFQVEGPLNFWRLNYRLESLFKSVEIGNEIFEELHANVHAINGNITTDKVLLKKSQSTLVVDGTISQNQEMNLFADGKNWRLEESNNISKINSHLTGNLNFSAELTRQVTQPHIHLKGAVTDTYFEENEIPNSNFIVDITRQNIGGKLSLFGNKVYGQFAVPLVYTEKNNPLKIELYAQDWSYSTLLGLVGGNSLAAEYESNLTASVELLSEQGQLFKSSGVVKITDARLQRGPLHIQNKQPIEVHIKNGFIENTHLVFAGAQNAVEIRGSQFSADNLNVQVNATVDLRLLQIFFPFLDDLGGRTRLATTVSGSLFKPQILGNLTTRNAFLKIKGFPHPLERLSTDVSFSQSRVLINSIRSQVAGGSLLGDGTIAIEGVKNLPTEIKLNLSNVTLNVPDKVRTSGDAALTLSGKWFPFTLKGAYEIRNGLVEMDFTQASTGVAGVRQNFYLPKVLKESRFEAITLDLSLELQRPLEVRNDLIKGAVAGRLRVKGPPENAVLLGRITTENKAKLIFKDKIFEVLNGVIEFDDPNEINPRLYISANSRINEYDINLIAQGPSKNPQIILTSVPPLLEQDIISLIALGITTTPTDQSIRTEDDSSARLSAEIGGAVLAKPINQTLESVTGFNFQVTSRYDSMRNISVPKITLSRSLSEKVKVSGSRPVRDSQSYDLRLEYLFNSNWTGVGSFESRGAEEYTNLQSIQPQSQSIFGIDLEFRREFK